MRSHFLRAASPKGGADADAAAYIAAVEAADGQALEAGVKDAINTFVAGCKTDGIWSAIKASCILAGARTLTGALVPLVGTAPTSNNFVSGDYDRETGLIGNAGNKYLNSNRNNNADPQNSNHNAVYVSTAASTTSVYLGASAATNETGDNNFGRNVAAGEVFSRNRSSSNSSITGGGADTGFIGVDRSSSANFNTRVSGTTYGASIASASPYNSNICIFAGAGGAFPANSRFAFYSIGESLDLALLDSRVTTLISDYAAAI